MCRSDSVWSVYEHVGNMSGAQQRALPKGWTKTADDIHAEDMNTLRFLADDWGSDVQQGAGLSTCEDQVYPCRGVQVRSERATGKLVCCQLNVTEKLDYGTCSAWTEAAEAHAFRRGTELL